MLRIEDSHEPPRGNEGTKISLITPVGFGSFNDERKALLGLELRIPGAIRRRKRAIVKSVSRLGGGAERRRLGSLLHDSIHQFEGLRRISGNRLKVSYVHQAFLDGIESLTGAFQNGEQIFLRDGAISGVNEIPPAADGLLDLNLCLFADDQGVD